MAITLTENAAKPRVAKAWKQWTAGYAQDLAEFVKVTKTNELEPGQTRLDWSAGTASADIEV